MWCCLQEQAQRRTLDMEGAVPGSCSAEGESLQQHPPAKTTFFAAAAGSGGQQSGSAGAGAYSFSGVNSKLVGIEPLRTSCKKPFLLHILVVFRC